MKILLLVVFCGALGACQSSQMTEPSNAINVGDGITVDPQIEWTRVIRLSYPGRPDVWAIDDRRIVLGNTNPGSAWTIDGLDLDQLVFFTGVPAGAPLPVVPGAAPKDVARYNTTMLPDDVMEMIAGALGKAGSKQLRTFALRPVPFGTVTGFRFDLAYTTQDGLQMKGMALFAQRGKKLDVILFLAPSEYYFGRYAPAVERIFSSVQVPDVAVAKPAS